MYGAPVIAPMEIPQELPSYFTQVPAPIPVMQDATVGTLRLEGTLLKNLPPMPSGALNDLSFTNSRQIEAAELMNDLRAAYQITRMQEKRSKAIAKARGRQTQRAAERR